MDTIGKVADPARADASARTAQQTLQKKNNWQILVAAKSSFIFRLFPLIITGFY
jgi:hypothetical protein